MIPIRMQWKKELYTNTSDHQIIGVIEAIHTNKTKGLWLIVHHGQTRPTPMGDANLPHDGDHQDDITDH